MSRGIVNLRPDSLHNPVNVSPIHKNMSYLPVTKVNKDRPSLNVVSSLRDKTKTYENCIKYLQFFGRLMY